MMRLTGCIPQAERQWREEGEGAALALGGAALSPYPERCFFTWRQVTLHDFGDEVRGVLATKRIAVLAPCTLRPIPTPAVVLAGRRNHRGCAG